MEEMVKEVDFEGSGEIGDGDDEGNDGSGLKWCNWWFWWWNLGRLKIVVVILKEEEDEYVGGFG